MRVADFAVAALLRSRHNQGMTGRVPRLGGWVARGLVVFLAAGVPVASAEAQLLGGLSEAEEVELGSLAAQQIEEGLELLSDDLVVSYVADLGQTLVVHSGRRTLTYEFKVVDAAEINAFALPGGFIYINRGLIEAADDEAELVGVLGHEIGHVVARHGAKQAQRAAYANLGLRVLGSILGGGARAEIGSMAAQMVTAGTFTKFGRDAEREADRLGAENVAAAGHDPNGMLTFFEKLAALRDGQANVVERFFASHPEPAERVANIEDLVASLRQGRDLTRTSQRFGDIQRRLLELPAPPSVAEAAASADDPESLSTTETDATGVAPVPVSYSGAEQDLQIAARFAPVFRQALGPSPRYDYITRFDFDGDWRGDNNWSSAADDSHPLTASVYFNVSETETHYFVHYATFHPRDYKGGNIRGVVLSEILREGAERHGDYDPTGLSQAAVLAHENDMEGALVVVEKATGLFGSTRVVYVETLAHNQFLQYPVDRRYFGGRSDGVRVDDEHPVLYIEPKGHGVEAYQGESQLRDSEGVLIYRYTGDAEEPSGARQSDDGTEEVGYDLISLSETLWPFARGRQRDIFGAEFDYHSWTIHVRNANGTVTAREVEVGDVGSKFRGTVGGRNMARPPWGWYDQDEEDQRQGGWFLTPAETVKRHFELDDAFSTIYVHHPVLGVFRTEN